MRFKFRRSAFTSNELLILVAIIAIPPAIADPNFLNAQTRANLARGEADDKSLSTALEAYRVDQNVYPVDSNNTARLGLLMLTTPVSYINRLPSDPFFIKYFSENLNLGQSAPDYELGTDTTWDSPQANPPEQRGTYLLSSVGLDTLDSAASQFQWPYGAELWDFDSTVGLNSFGDIYTTGGVYQHEPFSRNGRPNRQ